MSEFIYVTAQAWGDNVVSLRLLQEAHGRANLRILGTRLTREVAEVLRFDAFPIEVMPTGVNACYDVRAAGFRHAARDLMLLARTLRGMAGRDTTVLLENPRRAATHRLLQLLGGNFRYRQPRRGTSAYADRQAVIEDALAIRIVLPPAAAPIGTGRVLIAPGARMAFRAFPPDLVGLLLDHFGALGSQTCLLDPDDQYRTVRACATTRLVGPQLVAGADRVRQADLVIAADSLFLHLAYALGVPVVALVPDEIACDFYFAPPGLTERGLFASFRDVTTPEALSIRLKGMLRC
jgi:hypothetical protein